MAPEGPARPVAAEARPARPAPTGHAPKGKPDPNPARLALAGGGLAILSAIVAGIVVQPPNASGAPQATLDAARPAAPTTVSRAIRYVHLAPGQTPPPGATVIDAAAPQPTTIVTHVAAPAQQPIIVKTTQSGKVVK